MKKRTTLLALICSLCLSANANLIFTENFNYTLGNLYNQGGWVKYAKQAEDPIQVVNTPLTYAGYQTAASGYAVKIGSSNTNGEDLKKHIGHLVNTNGNVAYIGALLNVSAVGTNYFLAVCDSAFAAFSDGTSPSEKIKLYAMAGSAEGKFKFALGKGNAAYVATEAEYDLNTTYLVVIKYEFVVASGDESSTKTDDPLYLFVNPALTAEPSTSTAVATINGDTYGSDIAWRGANAIELKQGQTSSKTCPTITIDNIRIATTWSDLLTESGATPTPEPTVTPEILVDNTITFSKGNIYTGTEYSANFYIYADNLTGDVTLVSDNNDVTLSRTSVTKAEAEAGIEITATLNTATAGDGKVTITVSSTGAEDVTVTSSWTAVQLNKVSTIAALKEGTAADATGLFLYTGEAIITYSEPDNYYTKYYLEDASGAVRIDDWYCSNTYNVGDKVKDVYAIYGDGEDLNGQVPLTLASNVITVVSNGNEPTPQVVTLEQLQANAADYLLELVKVEGVSLDQTSTTFSTGNSTITQNGTAGAIGLTSDNTLVGTAKPKKANIIGLSYNKSGYNIRIRTAADVIAIDDTTTDLENNVDNVNNANNVDNVNNANNLEIYTISGQRVNTLQQGVNIIRQGSNTYKVIR